MSNRIQIVQGGQWGSEAKGAIAAYLCQKEGVDYAVRTGATNAGHTVLHNGVPYKMQQLPVGWVNPNTKLVLGAGAMIDIDILKREVRDISKVDPNIRERIYIDHRAGIHHPVHADRSKASGRHHMIGATGKGCSEAVIDKIRERGNPDPDRPRIVEETVLDFDFNVTDTCYLLNTQFDEGASIQLEGTQGTLLDLHLGNYPYTTHKQTGPAQWMMECGLSPALPTDIVAVFRTFPIRVAGNSGPMPNEISWQDFARYINKKLTDEGMPPRVEEQAIKAFEHAVVAAGEARGLGADMVLAQQMWPAEDRVQLREALSEVNKEALEMLDSDTLMELSKLFELTTVTRKLRRIAGMSEVLTSDAISQIRPHRVVITFMNYIFPQYWGQTGPAEPYEMQWLEKFENRFGVVVSHMNRGPAPEHIISLRWDRVG